MPDHVHILVSLDPKVAISDLVRDIKAGTSKFINTRHWFSSKFSWQKGFSAFSYSPNHIPIVINYILGQKEHHRKRSFKSEYLDVLTRYDISYEEKYPV